jgi:uncharacterized protein (TIGR02270 family)
MPEASAEDRTEDIVIWDIVEEHLDEAEFHVEQLDRALDSPTLSLEHLASGSEQRLLAHVDGLRVGGPSVYERLVKPLLLGPDVDRRALTTVATLLAVETRDFEDLRIALGHESARIRAAAVRGCAIAGGIALERWVLEGIVDRKKPAEQASLLEIAALGRAELPPLLEWLQSDDALVAGAAARAVRRADARLHLPVTEALLEHDDPDVREAALVPALAWGSSRATAVCERLALDARHSRRLPMALYALLGGPREHARLAEHVSRPTHRLDALFALGYSGNPDLLPLLSAQLEGGHALAAKFAAQAIATIMGLDLRDDAFFEPAPTPSDAKPLARPEDDPEARGSLPPLEQDDLDGDIVPPPEDALRPPNAVAIRRFCEAAGARTEPGRRYLDGQVFTREVLLDSLRCSPLGRRHMLAIGLAVGTEGAVWLDTRAPTRTQSTHMAAIRAAGGQPFVGRFGRW